MSNYTEHESNSITRYNEMQDKLNKHAAAGDEAGLRLMAAQLDAQLKLEDFLVRFREADHAKIKVWGTIFVSSIVSIILAIITTLVTMSAHNKP